MAEQQRLQGDEREAVLTLLRELLADARRQQTVLRESLATVVGFLDRPHPG